MKKLDKELVNSLHLLEDNDNSTEIDSEESISATNPTYNKNKKLILSDFMNINKENIYEAIINTKNKYIWLIKNNTIISELKKNNN